MTKRMLIDDTRPEETRVVIVNGNKVEDVEFESASRKQIKGNIYLAKVMRVEPSLQAAFVDIGAQKNAFLHYHDMLPGYDDLIEKFQEEHQAETVGGEKIQSRRSKRKTPAAGSKADAAAALRKNIKLSVADIPEIFKPGMEILVQVVKALELLSLKD